VIGAQPSSTHLAFAGHPAFTGPTTPHSVRTDAEDAREILDMYCVRCHNERRLNDVLALDMLDVENPATAAGSWETVIRKLRPPTWMTRRLWTPGPSPR